MKSIVFGGLILVAAIWGLIFNVVQKYEADSKNQFNQEMKYQYDKMRNDSILKCQELSATTQDENWTYKSCLKELKLSNPEVKTL
jgi:hypothetical protein